MSLSVSCSIEILLPEQIGSRQPISWQQAWCLLRPRRRQPLRIAWNIGLPCNLQLNRLLNSRNICLIAKLTAAQTNHMAQQMRFPGRGGLQAGIRRTVRPEGEVKRRKRSRPLPPAPDLFWALRPLAAPLAASAASAGAFMNLPATSSSCTWRQSCQCLGHVWSQC